MTGRNLQFLIVLIVGVLLGALGYTIVSSRAAVTVTAQATTTVPRIGATDRPTDPTGPVESTTTTTTTPPPVRDADTVPGWTVGEPWGSTIGLTMFRGNPTRTYYGLGPVPDDPSIEWRYPEDPMCRSSSSGGETKVWCGNGWTGQPIVWERPDGITELIFGAYDGAVHFVDAATGQDLAPPFQTGDIIKGTVTLDPDGYPLLYFGSRDNKLRIIALDRETPELMWSLDAAAVDGIWNDDWDSNPVIVDDIMYEGGENGWFFATVLNREYLPNGQVNVDPDIVFMMPGYDDELISKSGRNVSIETSVAVYEQRVYFANSGGRVLGLDVSDVRNGNAPIVFDYYAGGDIDATIVVDEEGMLYVSIEHEPAEMGTVERERNLEVGQLVKLDPYATGDPRIWGLDLTAGGVDSGLFATPALYEDVLYVNTHLGDLIAVDAQTGELMWSDSVGAHSWSSPAVIDGHLVTATCAGDVRSYSLDDPLHPVEEWSVDLGGSCLEATPAIWKGHIYVGSRDGFVRALG